MTVINVIKWLKVAIYDIYDGHKLSRYMAIWVSNEPSLLDILIYEEENGFWSNFINKNAKKTKIDILPFVFFDIPFVNFWGLATGSRMEIET